MSLIGRPSRPPAALVSSSQIFMPSSACLPLAASGPVSDMPKPILIGSPLCAEAIVGREASAVTPRRPAAKRSNVRRNIQVPPLGQPFAAIFASSAQARQVRISGHWSKSRQLAAIFLHDETAHPSGTHGCPRADPYRPPPLHDNRSARIVSRPRRLPADECSRPLEYLRCEQIRRWPAGAPH